MLTFLLFLGGSSPLVLFHPAGTVRANRGAVNAGVLLLRLIIIHVVTLTQNTVVVSPREGKKKEENPPTVFRKEDI